jgi:hypothetical protein
VGVHSDSDEPALDSRIRRLLHRPWTTAYRTPVLERLEGGLGRILTSTGLLLRFTIGAKERELRGISLECHDADQRSLGQAYLAETEVLRLSDLLSMVSHSGECSRGPDFCSISLRTQDGIRVEWNREQVFGQGIEWCLTLLLRQEPGFSIPLSQASKLKSLLDLSLAALREEET